MGMEEERRGWEDRRKEIRAAQPCNLWDELLLQCVAAVLSAALTQSKLQPLCFCLSCCLPS